MRATLGMLAALALGGCTISATRFGDAVALLKRDTEVLVLSDRGGFAQIAVCPAFQGRVMTSTLDGKAGLGFGWINFDHIASRKTVPHINAYGGEDRFWMGPEGGQFSIFFAKGAAFRLKHWQTPAPIDSESYSIARRDESSLLFRKRMQFTNYSGTTFDLELRREIRLLSPTEIWRHLGVPAVEGVRMVGFQSDNEIKNLGREAWRKETGLLSVWILGMFNPSPDTTVIVPYRSGPIDELGPIVNDAYFGKVPSDRLRIEEGVLFFRGDGQYRSKIGVSPRRAKPILGSYDNANKVLTLVQYTLPEGATDYVNSMWKTQDRPYAGDAVNSYNDGPPEPGKPPLGPFYELESSSPAAALKPRETLRHVHRTFHFRGSEKFLTRISRRTLGVGLSQVKNAFSSGK